jgi:hypothetical protein
MKEVVILLQEMEFVPESVLAVMERNPEWDEHQHLDYWNQQYINVGQASRAVIRGIVPAPTSKEPILAISEGMPFRIVGDSTIYIHVRDRRYCPPDQTGAEKYAGLDTMVEPVETTLHSRSFVGLNEQELGVIHQRMIVDDRKSRTDGDRALLRYWYASTWKRWPGGVWK